MRYCGPMTAHVRPSFEPFEPSLWTIIMQRVIALNTRSSRRARRIQGFSLLEILLVLGIAAALIIAAFVVYPKVQAANRAQAEEQNIAAIAAGARSLYAGSSSYASISNQVLLNAKVFPDSMVDATGANVTNAWGGIVTVLPSTNVTNGFNIEETGVPQVECTKIVSGAGTNFTYIMLNGAQVKTAVKALDPATVAAACATGGANNSIQFEGL